MARPKMSVAAALGRGKAQGNVAYPTVLEVVRSKGYISGVHPGDGHSGLEDEHNEDNERNEDDEDTERHEDDEDTERHEHNEDDGRHEDIERLQDDERHEDNVHLNDNERHEDIERLQDYERHEDNVHLDDNERLEDYMRHEDNERHEFMKRNEDNERKVRFENPMLRGGRSRFVKLETTEGEDLPRSNQFLAPGDAVTPQVLSPQGTPDEEKLRSDEFVCTACGYIVQIVDLRAHPVLHVGVCDECYDFLFSSPFTKDNPQDPFEHENECRWCGDGGEVILCDTCPKVFCKTCIKRNFGEERLNEIESPTRHWSCFVCDDERLQALMHAYYDAENMANTMKRSGQHQKQRDHNPRERSRTRYINKTVLPDDTIASLIAQQKAKMRSKHPNMRFTGFDIPKYRSPQKRRHSLFGNINPESGTSNGGAPVPREYNLQNGHGCYHTSGANF